MKNLVSRRYFLGTTAVGVGATLLPSYLSAANDTGSLPAASPPKVDQNVMQIAKRDAIYSFHSAQNQPQITIRPGEVFQAETELCSGDWLQNEHSVFAPRNVVNPAVVVAIDGARPGDVLAVDILDVVPDRLGFTGFRNGSALANQIMSRDWGYNIKIVTIENGYVNWNDKVKLPIKPMLGVLGTAPANEIYGNGRAGDYGGNMDVQEVAPGATVYLPVRVPGALLHIGDAHAIQGDGEICGSGGIECRSLATLRARIIPRPENYRCVRIETDEFIATVGSQRSLEESFHFATAQLIGWMTADYGFSISEAYLLLGQIMEARLTQLVNPTYSYICKAPKRFLHPSAESTQ